jgi:hypothetical protein
MRQGWWWLSELELMRGFYSFANDSKLVFFILPVVAEYLP